MNNGTGFRNGQRRRNNKIVESNNNHTKHELKIVNHFFEFMSIILDLDLDLDLGPEQDLVAAELGGSQHDVPLLPFGQKPLIYTLLILNIKSY